MKTEVNDTQMKIVIIGAGSIGLLLAARLVDGGEDVQLITRSKGQALQLNQQGVSLHTLDGQIRSLPVQAISVEERWPDAEMYLLAVKQPALPSILPFLREIPARARVIALQNGIGHEQLLTQAIRADQLVFAVNTEGAKRISPTEVQHTGHGLLRVGPWKKQSLPDPLVQSFVEGAMSCGIPVSYVDEIAGYVWRKVMANAVINPLTALFEITNGALLDSPRTLELMRFLFEEAAAVAKHLGQKIDENDWQELLAICRNTSRNHSSMLQDLWSGKQTEIEAINGYLVKKGIEHGIPTPYQHTIREAILLKSDLRLLKGEASHGVG